MAEQNIPQVRTGSRFKAFVSYSHADKAAAQKLHRKLETYRLPKHLREKAGEAKDDGRVGAIFRDREDLPAAEDLTESVKQALAVSEALVVLCSPDARKSPWVAREIELFRELHPDRPILAAILRGEPNEAFPEPLQQGREPLAADLRKEGDGPRLGFLKIVAGIAGVPLDSLVNRDAQRQIKRVTAITVAALAAMVVMALMTTFAIQQRNEAQTQRAEAEGLIEYMLTDLRTELKGVGRLDVMNGVNERAMAFFEAQTDLDDLPAESLERRARILHAMGEDEITRGDFGSALEKFEEASRVTRALLAQNPNVPDRIFGHAQSEYWVGRVYELQGNAQGALVQYEAYNELAMRLSEIEPAKTRSKMEVGYAQNNLGIVQLRLLRKPESAEKHFKHAVAMFQEAVSQTNTSATPLIELGNAQAWESDSHFFQREWQQARVVREQERTIIDELLGRQPQNRNFKYRELVNRNALLEIRRAQCKCKILRTWDPTLLTEITQLTESDPNNNEWAELLNIVQANLK
ncbi:toll/interleukin-1 receptor domain-containing protein [Pontixanthobacter aquaemixtae]|uniref:TIR domain-containing protein n=1 Tax=Pontixanthobacter aquaemixtae TaxID=1958940 RepID=A0A844ZTE2_9SPHN|nr:toll/interleukin-1 receptor domain-containing protein [Pontixanthobacter aquaemixtae]MXO90998.1 TIR domain-containing protein [Pontixanthobacter aquaemixtae]